MNFDGEEVDDGRLLITITAARRIARDGTGRLVRKEAGASLAEVGRAVGVSKASICKWELGQREPTGMNAVMYLKVIRSLAPALWMVPGD
jgi:DNA-binding transcriptional regulator YiaG